MSGTSKQGYKKKGFGSFFSPRTSSQNGKALKSNSGGQPKAAYSNLGPQALPVIEEDRSTGFGVGDLKKSINEIGDGCGPASPPSPVTTAESSPKQAKENDGFTTVNNQKRVNHDNLRRVTRQETQPQPRQMYGGHGRNSTAANRPGTMFTQRNTAIGSQGPRLKGRQGAVSTNGPNFEGATVQNEIHVDQLKPGTIIWHRECDEHYNENAPDDGVHTFTGPDGIKYYAKGRFWYVVEVFEDHWTEHPIYTYEGYGIEHKSDELKAEHVGVVPKHLEKTYTAQNDYEPVKLLWMKDKNERLSPKSYIKFTEINTSKFATTKIRIAARSVGESAKALGKLKENFGKKGKETLQEK